MKMSHSFCRIAVAMLFVNMAGGFASVRAEDAVKVRLGTLVPKGSSYFRILQELGESWRAVQGQGSTFVIYGDGSQGGEADMVKRMRVGQLNAALLSAVGLAEIDKSAIAMQTMPMLFRDWAEVDYVRERVRQTLEARLAEKGFVVLLWADGGWVRYFSKEPAATPAEFKRFKLFAWAGDTEQVSLMKSMGYQPVPLETADILPGLQTGLINAVATAPFFALAGQFSGPTPYMLDIKWVPIVGAAVMTRKLWDAMSPAARDELKRSGEKAGLDMRTHARREDLEAIEAMKKRGLKVTVPSADQEAQWRATAEETYPRMRGGVVPAEMWDEIRKVLDEYRNGKKKP
jgi:TRAP-type C4-dicarboxylate transport system substrate-binding protein